MLQLFQTLNRIKKYTLGSMLRTTNDMTLLLKVRYEINCSPAWHMEEEVNGRQTEIN